MSNNIEFFINKNEKIIACKKLAKKFAKENKQLSLSHCKDLGAIELGFQNWFDLQNTIKQKSKHPTQLYFIELKKHFEQLISDCLSLNSPIIIIEARNKTGKINLQIHDETINHTSNKIFSYQYLNDLCSFIWHAVNEQSSFNFNWRDYSLCKGHYNFTDLEGKAQNLSVKIQTVPVYPEGFDLVCQITPKTTNSAISLNNLGYEPQQLNMLANITSKSVGGFIISGTAGSGRTTTLKSLTDNLSQLNTNLKTYHFNPPLINNITEPYLKDIDASFSKYIKEFMRSNPDIITVNELVDKHTVDFVKKAIQSGHQAFTTVHASSALAIIERFLDFKLNPFELSQPDFINGVGYQRLLPVVCPQCCHSIDFLFDQKTDNNDYETAWQFKLFKSVEKNYHHTDFKNVKIRNKMGCKNCNHMGIIKRTVSAEIIVLDDTMRNLIQNNELKKLRIYWRSLSDNNISSGNMTGKTVYEHGLKKMLQGIVSPIDIINAFNVPD